MTPKEERETKKICSSHPDSCCECCAEFQDRIEEEKRLYMDNEKEWQQVLAHEKKKAAGLVGALELCRRLFIDGHEVSIIIDKSLAAYRAEEGE